MTKANIEALASPDASLSWERTSGFLELTKPRITFLVVATTMAAYCLGIPAGLSLLPLFHTLLGTALVAAGASSFNMYLERHFDGMMRRTAHRPLPSGIVRASEALAFAFILSAAGLVHLLLFANALTALLAAITLVSYLLIYTPLKRKTWLCTLVGAAPGALPCLIGWAAATGELTAGALILFAIVFFWQIPHFYAIGWMYREDYARAGYPMLPVMDPDGKRTGRQASFFLVALFLVSLLLPRLELAGSYYLGGSVALGLLYLAFGIDFAFRRDRRSARRLFLMSILYLPTILALLIIGKIQV